MAGDWVKVEHVTADKPEVHRIAQALAIAPEEVFGRLIRVWIWADQQSLNGHALSVTRNAISHIARRDGFAEAMEEVGWLTGPDGCLSFPNFERHNTETAKARALANKRQSRKRDAETSRPERDKSVTREEKRREEKREETPYPLSLDTPEFREAWKSWQTHRREIRKKLTPTTEAKQLKALAAMGLIRAIRCIEHTIEKGWMGLREPDAAFIPVNGKPSLDDLNAQMAAKYGSQAKAGGA